MITTNHEQLISRNRLELSTIFQLFHEVNSSYDNLYCLYCDVNGLELFDQRIGKSIIHHEFSHFRNFIDDLRKLNHDIMNVSSARFRVNGKRKPTPSEVWSIKAIMKIYGIHDNFFFNNNLRNYITHGLSKKTKDCADNY